MKFVSWNVNGLRACIQKGFLDEFNNLNADFFCLQETKLSEGQLQLDLPGYEQYWCYAEKKGYSGTAIFTKHTPLNVTYGIGVPELDNEGRVITLEYHEFYLLTCYTPNAQRGLARIDHRMKWDDAFRTYLQKLDSIKPVIICGDLNVAHHEIDLKNPSSNRGNAGFSDQERESFGKTLALGFTDTFRHLHPDATCCYSWWSYMFHARENNAGWRIDYFLVSNRLKEQIYRADIHSEILGSDHCPVTLELDTLVNGGLWSPECAPASIPAPPEKMQKEHKASPINGKALLSILLIFALLIGGIAAVCDFFSIQPSPPPAFLVEVSYTHFQRSNFFSSSVIDPEYQIPNEYIYGDCAVLISDDIFCWVGTLDGISTSNVFLRIDAPDGIDPEGWTVLPEVVARDLAISGVFDSGTDETIDPDILSSGSIISGTFPTVPNSNTVFPGTAELQNYTLVPYYTDATLSDFAGWLIWGSVDEYLSTELRITISNSQYEDYIATVSTVPYLYKATARTLTTEQLLNHITLHPDINESLTAPLEESGDLSLAADSYDQRFMSLQQKYPVLEVFTAREDAVKVLMEINYDQDSAFNNTMLSLYDIQSAMTPQQQALYVTGQYPNYPFDIVMPGIEYDLENMSTTQLLNQMQEYANLRQQLNACDTFEAARYVFDYHLGFNPFLQEFLLREDASQVLWNGSLSSSDTSYPLLALYLNHTRNILDDVIIDVIIYDEGVIALPE